MAGLDPANLALMTFIISSLPAILPTIAIVVFGILILRRLPPRHTGVDAERHGPENH